MPSGVSPGQTTNEERLELVRRAAVSQVDTCIDMAPRRGRNGKPARQYVRYEGRQIPAARAVWIESQGPIPPGHQVLHTCNRGEVGCINIQHLYLGGHRENSDDRIRDGVMRGATASQLTAETAAEIKGRLTGRRGEVAALAREYGVSFHSVWNLKQGKSWSWV